LLSGAAIEAMAERAKLISFNRPKSEDECTTLDDFMEAVKEQAKELEEIPKAEKVLQDWLATEGIEEVSWRLLKNEDDEPGFGFVQTRKGCSIANSHTSIN
jgi:hypothetical protein